MINERASRSSALTYLWRRLMKASPETAVAANYCAWLCSFARHISLVIDHGSAHGYAQLSTVIRQYYALLSAEE
jgi:hypothetical protein